MKLIQLLFLFFLTLSSFKFAKAQTAGKISGTVLDDAKKPLDGATVILLTAKDSAVVSTQLAKADGSFAFQGLPDNNYLIKVTYIGYKNFVSSTVAVSGQKPNPTQRKKFTMIPHLQRSFRAIGLASSNRFGVAIRVLRISVARAKSSRMKKMLYSWLPNGATSTITSCRKSHRVLAAAVR